MQNLPNEIVIGRYHSLYVERDSMPDVLSVTASTEDGVAMAIEHKTLPVGGVQFHPESLMSLGGEVGLRIVENAFRLGVGFELNAMFNPRHSGMVRQHQTRNLRSGANSGVRCFASPRNDEEEEKRNTDDF